MLFACGKKRRPRLPARRGAAAVEFALVASLFFFVLFGMLEMSRMNMIRQTANNAAYEGARKCVVPGATASEATSTVQRLLQSIGVTGYTVTMTPTVITSTTPEVTVQVSVPLNNNMWMTPLFMRDITVGATCRLTRDWVVATRQ